MAKNKLSITHNEQSMFDKVKKGIREFQSEGEIREIKISRGGSIIFNLIKFNLTTIIYSMFLDQIICNPISRVGVNDFGPN